MMRDKRFGQLGLFMAVGAVALVLYSQAVEGSDAETRDGVFIHISHGDDPHRVLMALRMAEIMAEDKDVAIYFDISGVGVVLEDSPDIGHEHFPSSQAQIEKLLKSGVYVCVCPGCLKAAGKTPEDVMKGVQIASKEAFFTFTKGRILTLDY